jgi:hypothetical protein
MQRNMDLLRSILLRMEESQHHSVSLNEMAGVGANGETVGGHLRLLADANYVEAVALGQSIKATHWRITWTGYEFLESVRNDEIWTKTKTGASKVGSWSVKLIGDLATGYIKAKATELGLPLA